MVTDVMIGGELVFALEGGSTTFWLSQDVRMKKGHRKRKTARILTRDRNPWHSMLLLNKRVKALLFLINIFRKNIDLSSQLFLTFIFSSFDKYPRFRFQVFLGNWRSLFIVDDGILIERKRPFIHDDHLLFPIQFRYNPLKRYYIFIRGKSQRRNEETEKNSK